MFKHRTVDAYPAVITQELLAKWQGVVRVWDTPHSAIEGAQVLDQITVPTEATVIEEQLDMFGAIPQRARVRYSGDKEGWVIYEMLQKIK